MKKKNKSKSTAKKSRRRIPQRKEDGQILAKDAPQSLKRVEEKAVHEWGGLVPTDKEMGLVKLTLDRGVKTNVVGTVYGLDYRIEEEGYMLHVFFDYYSRRLKVIDYEVNDYSAMTKRLAYLAEANDFDKIFLKAKLDDFQIFLSHGYLMEGILRYYFRGEDAYILSRFSSKQRAQSERLVEEAQLIEKLIYHSEEKKQRRPLEPGYEIVRATEENIPELVLIYRGVFETYPSPLTSPDYIKSTMHRNVIYRMVVHKDTAIAAASAEINRKYANAELTDCATIPEAQGKGLMQHLLLTLEDDLRGEEIMTSYSLARAISIGMNKSFFRLGYEFSGRLINNCDIFGRYEDMNIWVKRL